MLGKLAITALMRRFPRPITPDNDTATKNARSITGPGHKPRVRSGADSDSERAQTGAGTGEQFRTSGAGGRPEATSRARLVPEGVLRARARLKQWASAETRRHAEGG